MGEPLVDNSKSDEHPDYEYPKHPGVNNRTFGLTKSIGYLVEHLPRIPMADSVEKASFELQMNTAILVERKIAEKSAKEKLPVGYAWEINRTRKDPSEIIKRGLEIFEERNPGIKIIYKIPEKRISEVDFVRSVGKFTVEKGFTPNTKNLAGVESVLKASLMNLEGVEAVRELLDSITGDPSGDVWSSDKLYKFFEKSEQVLQEELLAKAMEITNGDVFESINILAEMTKAVIRPDINFLNGVSMGIDNWFKYLDGKFVDELSDFMSFNKLPVMEIKDSKNRLLYEFSQRNRLGEIYHMWEIIRLTTYFTPEMVRVMVLGEYAENFTQQGHLKLLSDLRVCADLYKIQDLFRKEAVRNSETV